MGHPWDDFLDARLRTITWMRERGESVEVISLTLSCDPEHVRRLMGTIERNLHADTIAKRLRASAERAEELFKKAFGADGVRLRIDTGDD